MAALGDAFARFGVNVVGEAAELGAGAAVGASARDRLAHVALARIAHAERAVNEAFDAGRLQGGPAGGDFGKRQFAREHHLRKAGLLEKGGLFPRRADVALGRGVELDVGQGAGHEPHVLHDQHVDAGLRRVKGERPGAGKLLVGKERVERHEDARVVAVGVVCEPRNVLHRVAGGLAGSEGGAADVDGVGAVVDRGRCRSRRRAQARGVQGR